MNPIRLLLTAAAAAFLLSRPPEAPAAEAAADAADIKVQDLRAGGDEKKRYFVNLRPGQPPKDGWRTLYVLPGGPGTAEFQGFVTNIAKSSLPENYLVVQLVAPVWTPQQAQTNVWPMEKDRGREVKFSTVDFFEAVHKEVSKAHKLDPRYIFTLTWSSSGSNGYTFSLLPKSVVTGSFVAMSVFRPDVLPPLSRAKGKPYFIYHSPADSIPFAMAEAARDALKKAGATVELLSYNGGHGWHGDTMGNIRKGVQWLEEQIAKPAK
jgi:predicted esterase